uniref:Uncharacterized protein n=1 Tax=Agarophyton chilense TaxID=2510777 RepID=A0A141SEL8_AGACH|nr:hypothetical protein Gchil_081 [Agarophyton chilense]AMK96736.1 hypothetical protein Gchil_081 [Agarophyton chilense]ASP44631.1 hypothetical protein [Agarophyton chilense]UAD84335.1 hypothetical protein [Agarophyton chilense]
MNTKLFVFYWKKYPHLRDYPICFTSDNYSSIYQLIHQHDYIKLLSIQHIQYISKELYKANLCVLLCQTYIQS